MKDDAVSTKTILENFSRKDRSWWRRFLLVCAALLYGVYAPQIVGAEINLPETSMSTFFVENSSLPEPFRSLDASRKVSDIFVILDGSDLYPGMHDIVQGQELIIGMRRSGRRQNEEEMHSGWFEDITILVPRSELVQSHEHKYQVPQVVAYYSSIGKEGYRSHVYGVACKGAVVLSVIDSDTVEVRTDLTFTRLDIESTANGDSGISTEEHLEPNKEEKSLQVDVFAIKENFKATRRDYRDLLSYEGREEKVKDLESDWSGWPE